jgi:hypothetical protein
VSLYYPLPPVQKLCPDCKGFGNVGGNSCRPCGGIGRVWIDGGPSFGCKFTLEDCQPGQIATLGNGDRGRVLRHCERGTPTTEVALIDPMFDEESTETIAYPSITGVLSMSASMWARTSSGRARARVDHLDPLQKETKAL